MILSLDHIAISVPDLDESISRFVDDLGLDYEGKEDVAAAKTATAFLPVHGPTTVELVSPLNGEGPIKSSLERRGPGLHHLCFRVDDLDADVERLKKMGYRFTSEAPTEGAHGMRVIFLHPKSTGGVLIELAQQT